MKREKSIARVSKIRAVMSTEEVIRNYSCKMKAMKIILTNMI